MHLDELSAVVHPLFVIRGVGADVSADVGDGGAASGWTYVDTIGDGQATQSAIDGRSVISLDGSSSQKYAYFQIDDEFFSEVHAGLNAIVEVTYKDDVIVD